MAGSNIMKDITPKLNIPSSAEVPYGVDFSGESDALSIPAGTMISPKKTQDSLGEIGRASCRERV